MIAADKARTYAGWIIATTALICFLGSANLAADVIASLHGPVNAPVPQATITADTDAASPATNPDIMVARVD